MISQGCTLCTDSIEDPGLVVMAKNAEIANTISEEIQSGQTEKTICRVGPLSGRVGQLQESISGEELLDSTVWSSCW